MTPHVNCMLELSLTPHLSYMLELSLTPHVSCMLELSLTLALSVGPDWTPLLNNIPFFHDDHSWVEDDRAAVSDRWLSSFSPRS